MKQRYLNKIITMLGISEVFLQKRPFPERKEVKLSSGSIWKSGSKIKRKYHNECKR